MGIRPAGYGRLLCYLGASDQGADRCDEGMLQQEDTKENRELQAELFRIEQYVEMALYYVRLGEGASDLVIQEYDLDDIIRKAIRKYAGQFIRRKIRVVYEGQIRK